LLSVHVDVKCGLASLCPAFMGGLSPALYRLVVPARQAENAQNLGAIQNIGASLKFTDFCKTIAVSISAQKTEKTQILTITVQFQFSYSRPPNQRLS
jgi:hypothetical protein